jgi:hypothetical protein
LRQLEKESHELNKCQDPNFRVSWRRWWNDIQVTETDRDTALKDPHIHINIKLGEKKSKDVHILLKAA